MYVYSLMMMRQSCLQDVNIHVDGGVTIYPGDNKPIRHKSMAYKAGGSPVWGGQEYIHATPSSAFFMKPTNCFFKPLLHHFSYDICTFLGEKQSSFPHTHYIYLNVL